MASFCFISFSSPCPSPACLSFLPFGIYLCGEHAVRILIFKDSLPLCYRSHGWSLEWVSHSIKVPRHVDMWGSNETGFSQSVGNPGKCPPHLIPILCLPFHRQWKYPSLLLMLKISSARLSPLDQSALLGRERLSTKPYMSLSTLD